jgi:hypothetical protein
LFVFFLFVVLDREFEFHDLDDLPFDPPLLDRELVFLLLAMLSPCS